MGILIDVVKIGTFPIWGSYKLILKPSYSAISNIIAPEIEGRRQARTETVKQKYLTRYKRMHESAYSFL